MADQRLLDFVADLAGAGAVFSVSGGLAHRLARLIEGIAYEADTLHRMTCGQVPFTVPGVAGVADHLRGLVS